MPLAYSVEAPNPAPIPPKLIMQPGAEFGHAARKWQGIPSIEVAPDGSPFRPLYDDRIVFNGQPVALVVAEELEIARHAASLVRIYYEQEAHVTDFEAERGRTKISKQDSPMTRRGNPARHSPTAGRSRGRSQNPSPAAASGYRLPPC